MYEVRFVRSKNGGRGLFAEPLVSRVVLRRITSSSPQLSPEDIKKLQAAMREKAKSD
jgi:hypothetical protein